MIEGMSRVVSSLAYGFTLLLFAAAFYAWSFHAPSVGAALFLSGIVAGLVGRILKSFSSPHQRERIS
jgi:hypothetical protein